MDIKLLFDDHITNLGRKASQKLHALSRVASYVSFDKKRILKTFIASQFNYCLLVLLCQSRGLNNKINNLHERALRIVFQDKKLDFETLLKNNKCVTIHVKNMQGIGIIKRLSNTLPRKFLLTIYKSFIRPHLDYCDIIYDQPNKKSFCTKIEHIQYNCALAITGAIKGTCQTKLYKELGLESLKFRRWFRRLCTFLKIKTSGKPEYIFNLIPTGQNSYNTRGLDQTETYYCRTDAIENASSLQDFKNKLKNKNQHIVHVGFAKHIFNTSALSKLASYENSFWNIWKTRKK